METPTYVMDAKWALSLVEMKAVDLVEPLVLKLVELLV